MVLAALTAILAGCPPISPEQVQTEKIRVACVGDSITYGDCVQDREKNCYPAVLSSLLGKDYDVRNFGVGGATLLKKGDFPWSAHQAFRDATSFNPQIVIIKLGTNDTKPQNWKGKADFETDYKALVEHFKSLPAKPAVWIALPVPVLKENFGINRKASEEQLPMIQKVAREEGCGQIDLRAAVTADDLFSSDGVHPNAAGARKIAETVNAALAIRKSSGR
ncbi:MAG TPA: GDSL-type esterase/lipase family protein [Planctomycetota bacterium]|nr:GDSL-type esterase/lipase family protein [Planctomycetota bacterium]